MKKDVVLCIVDYDKAFDRVQQHKLIQILKQLDIDQKDIRCIENVYWNQTTQVRIGSENTKSIEICRGVRQGCVLSPLLFNLYSEKIFQKALEDVEKCIKVNGIWINNIRYTDDTVLIVDNMCDLQGSIDVVEKYSANMGLNINIQKKNIYI